MKESQVKSTTSFDQQFTVITVQEILVICTCSFKNSHQNSFITSVSLKEKYIKLIIPFIILQTSTDAVLSYQSKNRIATSLVPRKTRWNRGFGCQLVVFWVYSNKKIRIVNAYVMLQLNNCPAETMQEFLFRIFQVVAGLQM